MSFNFINLYIDGFYTQGVFHRIQEHRKWSSNKEIMTVRSWRLPMNSDYEQNQQDLLFFMISGPNMSSNFIRHIYGWILDSFKQFPKHI